LLARTRPRITLGELHLEAMKLLVATLEKRKFAVNESTRRRAETCEAPSEPPRQRVKASENREAPTEPPRQR
jgi:hypothetical protein